MSPERGEFRPSRADWSTAGGDFRALTSVELLGCGALAGASSKTLLAPLDRVKLMYIVNKERSFTLGNAWCVPFFP